VGWTSNWKVGNKICIRIMEKWPRGREIHSKLVRLAVIVARMEKL
jgi:hypothetical protein